MDISQNFNQLLYFSRFVSNVWFVTPSPTNILKIDAAKCQCKIIIHGIPKIHCKKIMHGVSPVCNNIFGQDKSPITFIHF